MIESTFLFLPGVGLATERRLWWQGIVTWKDFLAANRVTGLSMARKDRCNAVVAMALQQCRMGNARFFAGCLRLRDHWRVYEWLRPRAVYLDIETSSRFDITVVGLYGNGNMTSLVRGESLTERRLREELSQYDLIVTFNGAGFDLPCLLSQYPRLILDQPHMDLYLLGRQIGLRGGLKCIEAAVGIRRPPVLQGMSGRDAARLWNRWRHSRREQAREILLAYNQADCVNLQPLADLVYCRLAQQHGRIPPTYNHEELDCQTATGP
jgi:uncharacterized protein YprB with RNaseH-like and TPR domain